MRADNKYIIALLAILMVVWTGCREEGPAFDGSTVEVTTGMCVPTGYRQTRQSDVTTQATGDVAVFRGIQDLILLPFVSQAPASNSVLTATPITLGQIVRDELSNLKHYKFFDDQPLYIGTRYAVVYGEAATAAGGQAENGVIVSKVSTIEAPLSTLGSGDVLSDITFSLQPMAADNLTDYQANLAAILNDIIGAGITVQGTSECDYFSVSETQVVRYYTPTTGTPLLWKNMVGEQPIGEESLVIDLDDDKLHMLFEHFSQLHSGSAASILEAVKSLYHVLTTYTMGTHAIQWRGNASDGYLIKACSIDAEAETGYTKMIIDRTEMKEAIIAKIATHFDIAGDQVTGYKASGAYYPGEVNLPDGSLPITYDPVNRAFTYENAGAILPDSQLKTSSICYPAALYYTVSSPLRTRSTTLHDADKLQVNTATAWTNAQATGGLWGTDKTGDGKEWQTVVKANTRTIVLTENLHYAVALLETSVRVASATLQDNNKKSDGMTPDPNWLAVPASGFPVTGILIGGQPDKVGWDLHAVTDIGETSYTQTIYDNAGYAPVMGTYPVTARYSTSLFSEPLRTLCLESEEWSDENENGSFYIALELKNNTGMSFVGADGVVPADGTFYLLAKLDLEADAAHGITGVNGAGIGTTLRHVLQQGYKTRVQLTIQSLKNAYNTIPDLRLTKLAFGMSVDLIWQQGAQFEL